MGTCDESHLRAAITVAGAAGTVTFGCSGTISLSATVTVDSSVSGLSLDGTGQDVTISGEANVQDFSVGSGVSLTLSHLTVANVRFSEDGGGVANSGSLTLISTTFRNNFVSGGPHGSPTNGAAVINGGTLVVRDSTFSGNTSNGSGGAIFNGGTLDVTGTTFSDNGAFGVDILSGALGGAIANSGTLHVTNSTFNGNQASSFTSGQGGAIANSGTLNVTNSTFNGNSTASSGGGEGGAISGSGTGTVTNTTFSGNTATRGGALSASNLRLANSIVANSTRLGNCQVPPIDDGGNLDDSATCGFTTANHSRSNVDPLLLPLASNGGPTSTMALPTTSPAIGFGLGSVCLSTAPNTPVGDLDQRGSPRHADTRGACDSGAYDTGRTGTTVTTPRVVTLSPTSNGHVLDVQSKIDCSPPSSDLTGPVGGNAQTTTTATQDQGAIVGQRSTALPCGRSGFALEGNAGSPPFHLGDAEISIEWSVQWLRSGCTDGDCVVTERGTADGPTEVIASGTQPPGVPPPF